FAAEMTQLVHGQEALDDALKITETFFKGNINDLTPAQLKAGLASAKKFKINDGDLLIDCLVNGHICSSKREARDLINQGSIQVNGQKQNSLEFKMNKDEAYDKEFSIIKKGKKNYFVCEF
ncbi:MAG: tyrosine--tRNA ligase, partial [Erysipelotrichaceae bacterium]|nr:tyrosine--tRNA ligase [Erysipelotrichaceae bacterium]